MASSAVNILSRFQSFCFQLLHQTTNFLPTLILFPTEMPFQPILPVRRRHEIAGHDAHHQFSSGARHLAVKPPTVDFKPHHTFTTSPHIHLFVGGFSHCVSPSGLW